MHPEILRELTAQRGRELRARARRDGLARLAARAARRRNGPDAGLPGTGLPGAGLPGADEMPAVPDYVDGSFRTEPAGAGRPAA